MRNYSYCIFYYSCIAIFISEKQFLSEQSLYSGSNFLPINPFTLKLFSLPYVHSERFTYKAKANSPTTNPCTFASIVKQMNVVYKDASGSGNKKPEANEVSLLPWQNLTLCLGSSHINTSQFCNITAPGYCES